MVVKNKEPRPEKNWSVSAGESLLLERRRRDESQVQAAARRGMAVDRYREAERDVGGRAIRSAHLGPIRPHEKCYLLRRRAGVHQKDLATALGCTRLWVLRMEAGQAPLERLRDYWRV